MKRGGGRGSARCWRVARAYCVYTMVGGFDVYVELGSLGVIVFVTLAGTVGLLMGCALSFSSKGQRKHVFHEGN